jgi:hypothetical protein
VNITKLAGYILIAIAAVFLIIGIVNFGPKYAAAGAIGAKAESYGLQTNPTNLRFKMGFEFFVIVLVVAVIALAGWWLTTSEVRQMIWIIGIGIFVLISIIIRATPILPLTVAKWSAGSAFFGAQVQVVISEDVANQYVPISKKDSLRTAVAMDATGKIKFGNVVLDLTPGAKTEYQGCSLPLTVKGSVMGTACIAQKSELWTVPLIKVVSAASGLPAK